MSLKIYKENKPCLHNASAPLPSCCNKSNITTIDRIVPAFYKK